MPDLTALSALREAATPEPWHYDSRSGCGAVYPEADKPLWNCLSGAEAAAILYHGGYRSEDGMSWETDPRKVSNYRYIVALVNAAPALIAELEAAREVVAAAQRGCDKCLHDNDDDTPEECRDIWGCGFADTRVALANHKEATRHE